MDKYIKLEDAINLVHKTIHEFLSESEIVTAEDNKLFTINKVICHRLKELPITEKNKNIDAFDSIVNFKLKLKEINNNDILKTYRDKKCDKCVWSNECFPVLQNNLTAECPYPHGHEYERDSPDGGYYG